MNVAQGVVKSITSKPAGRGTANNIKMDRVWYGHGFVKPTFEKGDTIKFAWEPNGNFKNIDAASVEILTSGGGDAAGASVSPISSGGASKGTDWDAKDKRIAYMSARNTSCAVLKAAIELGIIKLTTKAANKYGAFVDAVEDEAQE